MKIHYNLFLFSESVIKEKTITLRNLRLLSILKIKYLNGYKKIYLFENNLIRKSVNINKEKISSKRLQ
tara:strand:+ start:875 stop:1078 length:204 start_codon:yes stop_codon:yes gene_type:complete